MSVISHCTVCRRTFALAIAALLSIGGAALIRAEEETPKAETEPSKLADDLVGAWTLAEAPIGQNASDARRLKFFGRKHWTVTQADENGAVQYHHGGTYTLDGDQYVETIEYGMGTTAQLVGQKYKFTIKVEGDKYTQTGVGNPYNEVWTRGK